MGFDPERTRPELGGAAGAAGSGPGRGTVLAGRYRLEMLLGEGGMAWVWSAYHLELQLPVAIKLLRTGNNGDRLAERLRLEARAAARLVHPSIVRVLDVAQTDTGEPFIVMELLTGENLAQLLARGRLQATRAVQLLLPIAEALVAAHESGVVHRDLKPDNVFISSEGEQLQPKLLDFGIAKLAFASARKLTDKGVVLGSPHYMSPEQVRGDDVDFRSDIWSFCVVLYRAITGMPPFTGTSERATMDAVAGNQPPWQPLANVDEQLARLVCWGLEKDPAQRPTDMRQLGRRLAEWLLIQGISEDACGAPLVGKWLTPSLRPANDVERTQPSRRSQRARQEESTRRIVPARAPRWFPLLAAVLLLVGAGIFWQSSGSSAPVRTVQAAPKVAHAPVPLPAPAAPPPRPVLATQALESPVAAQPPIKSAAASRPARATRARPAPSSRLPF
ncbi:MAG TPA: serine/threonine-protein kinase [Polyangiaceae bacterium]|nr:serine/threonine-protein kinase [Polyangiaceae bacterium]